MADVIIQRNYNMHVIDYYNNMIMAGVWAREASKQFFNSLTHDDIMTWPCDEDENKL